MANTGLLFIPDITGFTKFVNETEIEHSRFIIEELLEVIINSNQIGLTVSEIEGDAVLFYRFGEMPSLKDIYQQVEKMFCNFQRQIKNYELRRVCQCKACAAAANLSLKVITHYGEFSTYSVKEYNKLIGKDVILAHQLLKNDIDVHEYWLVTNKLIDTRQTNPRLPVELQWQQGNKKIENSEVKFHYSMLTQLKDSIEADHIPEYDLGEKKIKVLSSSKTINAPMDHVFSIMGNFSLRSQWQEGVKAVDQVSHPIYQVGIKHRCITDNNTMVLYTSSFDKSEEAISLTETDEKKTIAVKVMLKKLTDNKTLVSLEYYMKKNALMQLMFSLFMKKKFTRQLATSLENLEKLCVKMM